MESIKSKLKLLLFSSGFYFGLAIIVNIRLIFKMLSSYHFINMEFENYISNGSGIFGVLLLLFFATFVYMIFVLNKIPDKADNEKTITKFKALKIFFLTNIGFAFYWFSRVENEIGGTPIIDGDSYSVYYKTEFIKHISEAQYYEYSFRDAEVTTYIFAAFFLFFSAMMFLNILEAYQENKNI